MLYSMLGRLTWSFVKRRRRRHRRAEARRPLVAALFTAGAVAASYWAQGRRASRR
jgi:hypothetical protein